MTRAQLAAVQASFRNPRRRSDGGGPLEWRLCDRCQREEVLAPNDVAGVRCWRCTHRAAVEASQ